MTIDLIEHEVQDAAGARGVMHRHLPQHVSAMERWQDQAESEFGPGHAELVSRSADAIAICLARILLRNGSASPLHRYFHDENHPLDLMHRLCLLFHSSSTTLGPRDYVALALFAAGHDLRQDLIGLDDEGIGHNERESAEELIRILDTVGLDAHHQPVLHRLLPPMIHGTTFHSGAFEHQGRKYGGGVLAPALVEAWRERKQAGELETDSHLNRLVLIATDIDTGSTADDFEVFADRGVRLCREIFLLAGQPELDSSTALGVYNFVTDEQERYFFYLQRFHDPETQGCFGPMKEANSVKLKATITALRHRYAQALVQPGHGIDGEQIARSYLEMAAQE